MNFYSKSLPYTSLSEAGQRRGARKLVRQRVSIGTIEQAIIQGHTIDVSAHGLSVLLPVALAIGEHCAVHFDLQTDGESVRIAGVGKVVNCTCSGLNGFRIGMIFKAHDAAVQRILTHYVTTY